MALAELIQAIEADADAQVRTLLATAEHDAATIDAEASRLRAERRQRAGSTIAAELSADADRMLAAVERQRRANVLAVRASMLERVHDEARALLPRCAKADLIALLSAAAHACVVGPVAAERIAATGVELDLASGTTIIATLDALLEREWPRLATYVLAEVAP